MDLKERRGVGSQISAPSGEALEIALAWPLSRSILEYLIANERAIDTADGIAMWWVNSSVVAVQLALDRLVACGAMTRRWSGSRSLYGLNGHPGVRDWLCEALERLK